MRFAPVVSAGTTACQQLSNVSQFAPPSPPSFSTLPHKTSLCVSSHSRPPSVILNRVFPLSFVFCVNITLGNISLQTIPVSFNQTIKAAVPACTVVLQTCA